MLLTGVDITEISRIKKAMANKRFCKRVLGSEEYRQLAYKNFPAQSVAASFSAKEAFSKAVGTGLGVFNLQDVQLLRGKTGRPFLKLSGSASEIAKGCSFTVSITHSCGCAAAVVMGEKTGSSVKMGNAEIEKLRKIIKPRPADSNKGSFGRLMCVCGSDGMAGAAVMSAKAALRCGAGLVDVVLPRSIYPIVAAQLPEPVFTVLDNENNGGLSAKSAVKLKESLSKASTCLIGCGLGKSEAARDKVYGLTDKARIPLVIDADGINIISENIDILKRAHAPVVLTPHPGEMSRLLKTGTADVQSHRKKYAAEFSSDHNAVLVLKGAGTLVAAPDGRMYENSTGNPGMATGGSGDVLAGMISSFISQGSEPFSASAAAVYLHGLAGDMCAAKLSQSAMLPTDIIEMLPELFLQIGR